jgi:hypothetical protein
MESRSAAATASCTSQAPGVAASSQTQQTSPSVRSTSHKPTPLPPALHQHRSSRFEKELFPLVFVLLAAVLAQHSPLSWSARIPGLGSYPLCPPCSRPFFPTLHPPFSWPMADMAHLLFATDGHWRQGGVWHFLVNVHLIANSVMCLGGVSDGAQLRWRSHRCWAKESKRRRFAGMSWFANSLTAKPRGAGRGR